GPEVAAVDVGREVGKRQEAHVQVAVGRGRRADDHHASAGIGLRHRSISTGWCRSAKRRVMSRSHQTLYISKSSDPSLITWCSTPGGNRTMSPAAKRARSPADSSVASPET